MFPTTDEVLHYAFLVGLVVALLKVLSSVRAKNRPGALPPCLPTLPLVGSLPFIFRMENIGKDLMEESKTRGKVFAFYAGSMLVAHLLDTNNIFGNC